MWCSRENFRLFRTVGVRTSPATVWRIKYATGQSSLWQTRFKLIQTDMPKINKWAWRSATEGQTFRKTLDLVVLCLGGSLCISDNSTIYYESYNDTVGNGAIMQLFNLLSWDISVWWINLISVIIIFGRLILNTVQWKTNFLTIWPEHLFDVNSHLVIAAYLYYTTVMLNAKLEIAYETKPLFKQMFTNFWMAPNCTL